MAVSGADKWDAATLERMVLKRHSDDVCVPQCKTGPTQSAKRGELAILDVWTMSRSWAHLSFVGYEIKVSRSDFLRDDKWPRYLDVVNCFYFVTPPGLLKPEEVPGNCGLLEPRGGRLKTRKAATRHEIEPPAELMVYVLMARAAIGREALGLVDQDQRTALWEEWLRKKDETRDLGYRVSEKVRRLTNQLRAECEKARAERDRLGPVRDALVALGLDPDRTSQWNLDALLSKRAAGLDARKATDALATLRRAESTLAAALEAAS